MLNYYSMTTRWEFGHEVKNPEKWKIFEWVTKHNVNANDDMHACVTLHGTNANDNIYACLALHNAHTCNHIHWASCAFSQVGCRVFIFTHTCTLVQGWVFHVISMAIHVCAVSSPWSSLSISCSTFRPFSSSSTTWSLWWACTASAARVWTPTTSSSSPQVMSPRPKTSTRPQSSPTCRSWTRCRSSPTKCLLRTPTTMTLHSKTCSIKYIEGKSITLYEKTCLSVCRRR